jgi:hypothetical protein
MNNKNKIYKTMKRKIFILALLLISAGFAFGQALNEQAAVLKKCLDIPALQQQFPTDSQGHPKAVYIMQHAVSFPEDIAVSKFGQRLIFLEKDDLMDLKVDAFILFEKFEITGSNADVIMTFNKLQDNGYQAYEIKLNLVKDASTWSVSETKANWR